MKPSFINRLPDWATACIVGAAMALWIFTHWSS